MYLQMYTFYSYKHEGAHTHTHTPTPLYIRTYIQCADRQTDRQTDMHHAMLEPKPGRSVSTKRAI